MAANNNILYFAALNGYVSGSIAGQSPLPLNPPIVPEMFAAIVTEATTWATAVDSAIAFNSTISDVGGGALEPTDGTIQEDQLRLTGALQSLSFATALSRYSADPSIPPSSAQIATVVAAYLRVQNVVVPP